MVNVLVVDDSLFMRRSITAILEKDPEIKVVGEAKNGDEAVQLCHSLDPDVITMDIEMPRMDGLTALKIIMEQKPCPVIMISSLTLEGAEATLKALDIGALDFIPKTKTTAPLDVARLETELRDKVRAVARRKRFMRLKQQTLKSTTTNNARSNAGPLSSSTPGQARQALSSQTLTPRQTINTSNVATTKNGKPIRDIVAIGVSTGGPPAVQKILSSFDSNFPVPILIAQHMPASFTGPFAKRLDNISALTVKEAEDRDRLLPGHVYIAPGGKHIKIENRNGLISLQVTTEPKEALYKPSANVLMESVGNLLGRRALGVILTGMGSDGLEGIKVLKEKGGKALAQNEASCVVYGMPKAIIDAGLADETIDIDDMANAIIASLYK